MNEYSLKLTVNALTNYIKTRGYSTSLLPITELSRDSYIEFLDRFIALNDWEGYNHRLLEWENFSQYLKNTIAKSDGQTFNGVNVERFTMAGHIDSIKFHDESISVRLIKVQDITKKKNKNQTSGDLIVASYVAFLFALELGLSKASIEIISVKSFDCPTISGETDNYKLNVNGGCCYLLIDDTQVDIITILNNALDYICN